MCAFPPRLAQEMLDTLGGLTLTALVSESKNYALYELDDAQKANVKAWQGDQLKRDVDVGKAAPSFRHTFVRLAGDDRDKAAFRQPIYSVALKGPQEHSLHLFAPAGGDSQDHPAVSSGSAQPFFLSEDHARRLMKNPEEFIKTEQKKEG
jgi:hypothetical protein